MSSPAPIPFHKALAVWIKISLLSFGGPAGQIVLMHRLIAMTVLRIGMIKTLITSALMGMVYGITLGA